MGCHEEKMNPQNFLLNHYCQKSERDLKVTRNTVNNTNMAERWAFTCSRPHSDPRQLLSDLSSWQWVYTELWRSPCLSICCLFTQLKHSSKRHTIVKLNGFMERSKKARGLKYQPSNTDKSSAQPDRRNKTALTSVRRPEALLASVQHFCTSSSSSQGGGESE